MALLVNKVASDHNELRRLLGHQGQQRFAVLAVFVAVKVGDLHDAQALEAVRQAVHADLGDGHLDAPQLPLQETPADSEQNQKRCHPSQGMAALLNLVCFIWRIRINHHHG